MLENHGAQSQEEAISSIAAHISFVRVEEVAKNKRRKSRRGCWSRNAGREACAQIKKVWRGVRGGTAEGLMPCRALRVHSWLPATASYMDLNIEASCPHSVCGLPLSLADFRLADLNTHMHTHFNTYFLT